MRVDDSVVSSRRLTGRELRDDYFEDIPTLTLGLVRSRGTSLWLGPIEIMRFGGVKTGRSNVELPIEGGLAVGAPGGHLRIGAARGRLTSTVEGYRPWLPLPLYVLTQLPLHHFVMRLHLLRERGRLPEPGVPAAPTRRIAAGAIDAALCGAVALAAVRGRLLVAFAGITAAYHVACWSLFGRTVGGVIARQRVVAVDGSRLSVGQSLLRLLTLPLAALRMRAVHDEIAGTEVVADYH